MGGRRKGFHALARRDGPWAGQFASPEALELGHCCRQVIRAPVIAIDTPRRWIRDGRPGPANGN